jgi:hypothetical protein
MLDFISNLLPESVMVFFRKHEEHTAEPNPQECTNEALNYQQVRHMPLASKLGARHKGCEISGHWTIRGSEVFLEQKRTRPNELNRPEISQNISKSELKGLL